MFSITDKIPPDLVISEEEVTDQLKLIDNSKPPDADGVSTKILKEISTCISITSPLQFFLSLLTIKTTA